MSESTAAPSICHACGHPIHSPITVTVDGHTYHQGCVPKFWACGCPIGSRACAYQNPDQEPAK